MTRAAVYLETSKLLQWHYPENSLIRAIWASLPPKIPCSSSAIQGESGGMRRVSAIWRQENSAKFPASREFRAGFASLRRLDEDAVPVGGRRVLAVFGGALGHDQGRRRADESGVGHLDP